jgi:hypothetical protein
VTPAATKLALVATLAATLVADLAFQLRRSDADIDARFAGWFLWLFTALFLVRVAGQLVVRTLHPRWLPPTEHWNLAPYRLLLPAQIVILAVMVWVDVSFTTESGAPVSPRPWLGWATLIFAAVYAGSMVVRYCVRMARRPVERWFGGTIPIVFHIVLASWLFVFGSFHASY